MKKIIGVQFEDSDKIYYFDVNKLTIQNGDYVIVDTERGLSFGHAVTDPLENENLV